MPFVLFNKPFQVLSQFTTDDDKATLGDFVDVKDVYPAGRLDFDSEGLMVLTSDGALQARISQPRSKLRKVYLAQVEGMPTQAQLAALCSGVTLKDGPARAVTARAVDKPTWLWPRTPPIRYRKSVADSWIEITLDEGRNRQVRRMTARVGLPTLRLIRAAVGPWTIEPIPHGQCATSENDAAWKTLRAMSR